VNASYRLGNAIVVGTVLASLLTCLVLVGPRPGPSRAGQDLGRHGFPLGAFGLVERTGRPVTEADFADRVCITSFIFTRCPLSCPRISSIMRSLQGKLAGTGVTLVSISVDPEYDTPAVLSEYARRFGADADRWWFLTGPKDVVYRVITDRFKLPVQPSSEADQKAGAEAVEHSDRLALVDHGKVVGYFDTTDPAAVAALTDRARQLDGATRPWARKLPAVNAGLNASCALLLTLGWFLIRSGRVHAHRAAMIASVIVSATFLACYLLSRYELGFVRYQGVGAARVAYFTVLLSHTLLATCGVVPLVALTLTQALRRRFHRHAAFARVTFPIWMYVSITGVVIYLMLYQLPTGTLVTTL
jgi:protein SCO1